jgi:hypothetical protein
LHCFLLDESQFDFGREDRKRTLARFDALGELQRFVCNLSIGTDNMPRYRIGAKLDARGGLVGVLAVNRDGDFGTDWKKS